MIESRRSKLEIYIDILRVLAHHGPMKLTHIMYKANVNCAVLKKFLDSLIQQKLVKETMVRKKKNQRIDYVITESGIMVLKHFKEISRVFQTVEEAQRSYIFL